MIQQREGKKSLVWLVAAGQIGPLMMLRDKPLDTFHLSIGVKALLTVDQALHQDFVPYGLLTAMCCRSCLPCSSMQQIRLGRGKLGCLVLVMLAFDAVPFV